MTKKYSIYATAALIALSLTTFSDTAFAGAGHGSTGKTGSPGKASDATRTINVTMGDNFYEPENISVKEGETVRFVVKNAGEFVHEFNIATGEMHKAHAPEMMTMMEHGVLRGRPGSTGKHAEKMQASMGRWSHYGTQRSRTACCSNRAKVRGSRSGRSLKAMPSLEFACNVPGHYEVRDGRERCKRSH